VELWLPETSDQRFGIVRELKDEGFTHYLCIPIPMTNAAKGWITAATKSVHGFSRDDLIIFALIAPVIATLINMRVAWLTLDRLLRTYVGDEPHRAILAGNVKRGQVTTIRSAILFADMRDSTGQTAEISAVQAVELFNAFFDCLVPPIEARGGEVLKYIGDGLLAIFREAKGETCDAATRALAAGEELLANVRAMNATRPGERPVEVGVALHYGEAAYGNVGSGVRLDFTVIGRDVGLASRIGGLNARLGEALLMSSSFVDKLRRDATPLGAFAVRGFSAPVTVFRPH
jgi:adenylate cyclase